MQIPHQLLELFLYLLLVVSPGSNVEFPLAKKHHARESGF